MVFLGAAVQRQGCGSSIIGIIVVVVVPVVVIVVPVVVVSSSGSCPKEIRMNM